VDVHPRVLVVAAQHHRDDDEWRRVRTWIAMRNSEILSTAVARRPAQPAKRHGQTEDWPASLLSLSQRVHSVERDRTEVGQVQDVAVGPLQTVVLTGRPSDAGSGTRLGLPQCAVHGLAGDTEIGGDLSDGAVPSVVRLPNQLLSGRAARPATLPGESFGFCPPVRPRALAAARPSIVRSRISACSLCRACGYAEWAEKVLARCGDHGDLLGIIASF
jgi:hypothetical protein